MTAFKLGIQDPETFPDTIEPDPEPEPDTDPDPDPDPEPEVPEVPDPDPGEAFFGTALFTRRPFFSLSPLQVIQHPRAFIDSFINHTLNRKIPRKIRGTTRVAIVTEGPINQQRIHRTPVTQTPIILCCGSEE